MACASPAGLITHAVQLRPEDQLVVWKDGRGWFRKKSRLTEGSAIRAGNDLLHGLDRLIGGEVMHHVAQTRK